VRQAHATGTQTGRMITSETARDCRYQIAILDVFRQIFWVDDNDFVLLMPPLFEARPDG
jgi:hypothetical protein